MTAARRIYLDHNAASPMRDAVAEAVLRASRDWPGNPSSVHAEGRAARAAMERAREAVAALVGGRAAGVVFTSGGTEAANLALTPSLRRSGAPACDRLVLGATEHACCLSGHRFPEAETAIAPVDARGVIVPAGLRDALRGSAHPLVAIQAANNETGVLQPLGEIADASRAQAGAVVVADAVQAAGRIPLAMSDLGLDAVFLSAHKLGGPKGVGALVLADGIALGDGLVRGGGQERGRRGGTPNVAGIVGFGVAAREALLTLDAETSRLRSLRDRIEAHLRAIVPGLRIFGEGAERLANTMAFAAPGLRAETAIMRFDLDGIAVSSGAACSSGKVGSSAVLAAMGIERAVADGAIRVSLGWNTTVADVEAFLALCDHVMAAPRRREAA